jgi:YesN/AraC family two-component response regulator
VAEELNISPRNLSEIINRELKQRFSNLINQYRIEDAKNRIRGMDKKGF